MKSGRKMMFLAKLIYHLVFRFSHQDYIYQNLDDLMYLEEEAIHFTTSLMSKRKSYRTIITYQSVYKPRTRIIKQIDIPLYLDVYMSALLGRDNVLAPYATISLLTSRKSSIPLGEEESKVNRWDLLRTSSATNFNNAVVTCIKLSKSKIPPGYVN